MSFLKPELPNDKSWQFPCPIEHSHAEKCPVCGGTGKLKDNTSASEHTCHGCNGVGWVTVRDS